VYHSRGGSRRAPGAWPLPSGPPWRQRLRRSRVDPEDPGGAAPDSARRSGPTPCDLRTAIGTPGARTTARPARAGALTVGALEPVPCAERGQPTGGSAAPGGLPPVRRGRLPRRSRRGPLAPARLWRFPLHHTCPPGDARHGSHNLGGRLFAAKRPAVPMRARSDGW
jgi:hypothetical protein